MARRHYLLTYDISDDKRRTRVFDILMGQGDHAQFSVFFCELADQELAELRGRLLEHLNQREDQLLILDLGSADNPLDAGLECLGKSYKPSTRVLVV